MRPLKIGTLAKRTGLSIRTLRYYDEIGLLEPSQRSEAGYRLYAADDILRLQQILSLRSLGFSLDDIKMCLAQPTFSAGRVIQLHRERLHEQMAIQQRLAQRLDWLAAHVDDREAISLDTLLETIEAIKMLEQYYTPDQLAELRQRADQMGPAGMRQAESDWQTLIDEVKAEMQKGTDPTSEPVLALARRYQALIQAFTGGDPAIQTSLKKMYTEQGPEKASRGMVDMDVMNYIGQAMEAL